MDNDNPTTPDNTPAPEPQEAPAVESTPEVEPAPEPAVEQPAPEAEQPAAEAEPAPETPAPEAPAAPAPAPEPQPEPQPAPTPQPAPAPAAAPAAAPKKNKTGLIIGLCVGGVAVIAGIVVLMIVLFSGNPVVGRWNCYDLALNMASGYDLSSDPSREFILNSDGSYLYGPYGELEKNHVKGSSFTVKSKDRASSDGFNDFYAVTLESVNEYMEYGEVQVIPDEMKKIEMEMAVKKNNGKREAVLIFARSYSMYYCYEK